MFKAKGTHNKTFLWVDLLVPMGAVTKVNNDEPQLGALAVEEVSL